MPFINVTFVEGPDPATYERFVAEVTDLTVNFFEVPREAVSVVLNPIPANAWGVGGTLLSSVLTDR